MMIKFCVPQIGRKEIKEVVKVLKSGNFKQGEKVKELEREFACYVGSKYAVAVSSCTNALFLCVKYHQPTEVEIPAVTFASVANVVLQNEADLKFRDQVHVGKAYPLYLKTVLDEQVIIMDSAHDISRKCFNGKTSCYSFYPTKQINGLEGGMIATNDKELAEYASRMRDHGKVGDNINYQIVEPGYHMRMNEVQAAVALGQLKKLDRMNKKRAQIRDKYNEELGRSNKSLHIYIVHLYNRDQFVNHAQEGGIDVSVHYKTPLHRQPAFKDRHIKLNSFPHKSEEFSKTCVSLPFYPAMTQGQISYICEYIKYWRNNSNKKL